MNGETAAILHLPRFSGAVIRRVSISDVDEITTEELDGYGRWSPDTWAARRLRISTWSIGVFKPV